jgi:hypothetical protein
LQQDESELCVGPCLVRSRKAIWIWKGLGSFFYYFAANIIASGFYWLLSYLVFVSHVAAISKSEKKIKKTDHDCAEKCKKLKVNVVVSKAAKTQLQAIPPCLFPPLRAALTGMLGLGEEILYKCPFGSSLVWSLETVRMYTSLSEVCCKLRTV